MQLLTPVILAIETTTDICSVSLSLGDRILDRCESAPREHTRLLLPMIDSLLQEGGIKLSDLNAFACTVGPGSFTGVRIGTAVVQALSFASNKPVVLISTLRAIAQHAYLSEHHEHVFAHLDAGQKEIYGACFAIDQFGIMQAITKESILNPNQLLLPKGNWISVHDLPNARGLLQIAKMEFARGKVVYAEQVQPVYLDREHLFKKSGSL